MFVETQENENSTTETLVIIITLAVMSKTKFNQSLQGKHFEKKNQQPEKREHEIMRVVFPTMLLQ